MTQQVFQSPWFNVVLLTVGGIASLALLASVPPMLGEFWKWLWRRPKGEVHLRGPGDVERHSFELSEEGYARLLKNIEQGHYR